MKKYFSGLLTGVLLFALAFSALAISGRMTIDVDPINIQVNGETFVPTDVNGKEVPVFAYEGTTYAPLRALAEAYGLEVGYDAGQNMATVNDPEVQPEQPAAPDTTADAPDYSGLSEEERAYQEWKAKWKISAVDPKWIPDDPTYGKVQLNGAEVKQYRADYCGPEWNYDDYRIITDQVEFYESELKADVAMYAPRLLTEMSKDGYHTVVGFCFGDTRGNWAIRLIDESIVIE